MGLPIATLILNLADDGGVKWRFLTWTAVVIAAAGAVALISDAVVAGLGQASGLAGVIVGFCELAALVLGVAGWASRRREASACKGVIPDVAATDAHPVEAASIANTQAGKDHKYVVDARGTAGLQVGDGNIQHNDFRSLTDRRQRGSAGGG